MVIWNLFQDLSVRYKLLAGFLLVTALLIAFGVYLANGLDTVDSRFSEVDRQYQDLSKYFELEVSNRVLADSVKAFILTNDEKWEAIYDRASSDFDRTMEELRAIETDPEELEDLDRFESINIDSFVERPVRDGPWSARVSGREAPRGCRPADLTALGAALRTSRIPCSTPSVAQGARWKLWSGALTRLRPQVPSRPPAEPCFPSPPGVHGPSA